jgi:outer membrane protein insertion porin family
MDTFRLLQRLISIILPSLLILVLDAQDNPTPIPTPVELKISRVDILYEGPQSVSQAYILANIHLAQDGVFTDTRLDQSIRSLYRTGLFEYVEASVEKTGEKEIAVSFKVRPKFRILEILFRGNEKIKTSRLINEVEALPGKFLDELTLKKDRDTLLELYRKKGFAKVEVEYETKKNGAKAVVIFHIDEGQKVRIKKVTFEGNRKIRDGRLRKVVETKKWTPLSWFRDTGKFREETLAEDIDKIREYYKERGYLDVEISEKDVDLQYPKPGKLLLSFMVKEGQQYSVGEVGIAGNSIFTVEEIRASVQLEDGDVFVPGDVEADRENVQNFYGRRGYLDTSVIAVRKPNLDTRAIDLIFEVREGEKVLLDSVDVQGNTKTKTNVILRELALAPGDVFDLTRMESSRFRLLNTRFFEDVNLVDVPTDVPGRRNMRITVKESRTGNLTFGAGFSSLEKAILFAEVTQGNFDLFNWRSFFQGDGQKFRLRAQLGSRSNEFVLYFEEPWLFEQRLAGGFELYRKESEFYGPFSERRAGFEVFLRKVLFEMVEGRFGYQLDRVHIYDLQPFASTVIQKAAAETPMLISKISGNLLRDRRRGNILFPSGGSRVELRNELAGTIFGGDSDYWKTELRTAKFIPTFESMEQTISLMGRIGFITSLDDSDNVPFFDRFFLGGPYTLRGFGYREVGPKDNNGEPEGGNTYGLFSIEYTFKIADPLRFAFFYDMGFAESSEFDFNPSNYNSNWGLGLRIMVMGAPLRLDLGFPLATDQWNDQSHEFNFSFGTRF